MRGEGLFRFTVSECYSPSQHGMETHGIVTQPGCKEPGTTAAHVVTNQEAGSGQNQGLGETNNLQDSYSWVLSPEGPIALQDSTSQGNKQSKYKMYGVQFRFRLGTLMGQWEELRQPAEANINSVPGWREYSTRGAASHTRIYSWLFFLIPTRQRGTIKSILGMGLKEVMRHRVVHRGWMSTINEALAPFCPSLGQFLFKAPSNWYLKVYVLSL